MKPKLSEHAARLAQVKRGLDQIADGFFSRLPATDDKELSDLIASYNKLSEQVEARERSLRHQNVQLAASVGRIEKLLDASIDGIAFIGQDRAFKFVNRRFCEILGLRPGMLNKNNVNDAQLLWKDTVNNPLRLLKVLTPAPHDREDGTQDVVDDVVELNGGEPRYAQVYGAPVFDDDGVFAGRIISLRDNTREIELDRLKTEFISVVSHELRTPLTSIKGYTDLMLSGATGDINDIQREFLGILQSSANRLGNLINDILDLSRIDAGRMAVKQEPVDYIKIVGDLMRLMKASADEKEISLDVSFPQNLPIVAGDNDKISQVLSNLLSNAIKYTPEGGWIKVLIEVTGEATVRTCVADSGIGITPADQKKLFQKFFRADNSLTREAGGTGLGLVIVKSIIEMLGGAIWVQSESGRGSKFFFTLPLYAERKHAAIDGLQSDEGSVGIPDHGIALTLVVDNSSFVRETLQHSLHRRGYGVITAGSADDALQKARQHKPDIILLDIMMDECSGFTTLSTLRADPGCAALPVVAFTLQCESENDQIALGAVSFIGKSRIEAKLVESIESRRSAIAGKPSILWVAFDPKGAASGASAVESLVRANIDAEIVDDAGEAIKRIVKKTPDVILIDVDGGEGEPLSSLLAALKSEREFARIPIVFVRTELEGDEVHFHLGDSSPDVRSAVDYLGEQVATVLRTYSYRLKVPEYDGDGTASGILMGN